MVSNFYHRVRQAMTQRPPALTTVIFAVLIGGVIGAVSRHLLTEGVPKAPDHFPWGTFTANLTGCFLMGILTIWLAEGRLRWPLAHAFFGTGILGGYTTFSHYAVETVTLFEANRFGFSLLYFFATLTFTLTAYWLGASVMRAIFRSIRPQRTKQ